MGKLTVQLDDDISSVISTSYTSISYNLIETDGCVEKLVLPDSNGLKILLNINIGETKITETDTPELFETCCDALLQGKIWNQLGYNIELEGNDKTEDDRAFQVLLMDQIIENEMFQDVVGGAGAIDNLNGIQVVILKQLQVDLEISDASLNNNEDDCNTLMKSFFQHLNYLMACNLIKWGQDYPLAFSYHSRIAYKASFPFLRYTFETVKKSKETQSWKRQELIVGCLRQLSCLKLDQEMKSLSRCKRVRIKRQLEEGKNPLEVCTLQFFNHQASL
ncbi:unnamed protein product [Ambrosiozyma monospora]|uniref:Unnamed protein product n=1 Tax=Ambrosiozyma monospora TaxID=43982 RepID=A0A9W6Z5W3_AMBMO|nr:unnamed protein product [Ambrosiozyma monospora]